MALIKHIPVSASASMTVDTNNQANQIKSVTLDHDCSKIYMCTAIPRTGYFTHNGTVLTASDSYQTYTVTEGYGTCLKVYEGDFKTGDTIQYCSDSNSGNSKNTAGSIIIY